MAHSTQNYLSFLELTLDLPGVMWWLIDFAEDPDHYYCNYAMKRTFHLNMNAERHSVADTCPIAGDYLKQVKKADAEIASMILKEYQALLDGEAEVYDNQFPYLDQFSKQTRHFSSRAKVLERDDDGRPTIIYGLIEEVTHEVEMAKTLLEQSQTDVLTGLNNRLKFEEIMKNETMRFNRGQDGYSLVFMDLDHFKSVNDTYGHDVGDQVLKRVAKLLIENFRVTDVVCRWGGEEFLILLPHTDLQAAKIATEKSRLAIAKQTFPGIGRMTASFGISQLGRGDLCRSVIERADQALYKAKELGRNRICLETEI